MNKLSVIIPTCNEWPQIMFTVRSIAEELKGFADFEIIVVDNYHESGGHEQDRSTSHLPNVAKGNPWLKVIRYNEKLSHWNAKRIAIEHSSGNILFFCDAHVSVGRNALRKMYDLYCSSHKALEGSIHLPLTYHILEWRKLIYKLVSDPDLGLMHYKFSSYRSSTTPYEVPCMSTCGMMVTRQIYDELGGWPKELGAYGGGENFFNFTLSVLNYKKWIMPGEPLYHHGDERGYRSTYTDQLRNRFIAGYIYGGTDWVDLMSRNCKGRPGAIQEIKNEVIIKCADHRELIRKKQQTTIQEWASKWDRNRMNA